MKKFKNAEQVKKMEIHFRVGNEIEVRAAFDKFHAELGYPKILKTRDSFPDYELEDENGRLIRAEAEYRSSGAQAHENIENECDLIICWEDDWPERKIPCLELSRHIVQQRKFHGFEKNELDGVWDSVKRIRNIGNKTGSLLDDLRDLVRTDKIHPYSTNFSGSIFAGTMELRFWLDGWEKKNQEAPVVAEVNFELSKVNVYAHVPLELVKGLSVDQWKDIAEELNKASFFIGMVPTGESEEVRKVDDVGKLAVQLKEGRVESLYFYYPCPMEKLLYEMHGKILEKLNERVVWLLKFINEKKMALMEKPS